MRPPLDRLEALVAKNARNEVACRDILAKHFSHVLLPPWEPAVFVQTEAATESGRTDIVIVADQTGPDGSEERVAYVWEVKAPQVYVLRKQTRSRLAPSKELYSAERQLLHYHSSWKNSDDFRSRWKITRRENVRIGGIVISRENRFVSCSAAEHTEMAALARNTWDIRKESFYRTIGLTVLTWTDVLKREKVLRRSHRKYTSFSDNS